MFSTRLQKIHTKTERLKVFLLKKNLKKSTLRQICAARMSSSIQNVGESAEKRCDLVQPVTSLCLESFFSEDLGKFGMQLHHAPLLGNLQDSLGDLLYFCCTA